MNIQNKVAVITGAGRGIGRAISIGLAKDGARVVAVSRTLPEIQDTVTQLQALGGQAIAIEADISNFEEVERVFNQVVQVFGTVDILINNAGVQGPIGPLIDNDPNGWIRTLMINLVGTFYCCRAALPIMIRQKKGKIINLSGGGATAPRPNFSAYAASKAAIVRLTETLAEEIKPYNIQVNAIAPGAINTKMLEEVLSAGKAAGQIALNQARRQKESGGDSLEKVIGLVKFLASDASGNLTGKLISAQHDPWQEWAGKGDELNATPLYTIRRLDPFTIKPLIKYLGFKL